MWLVSFNLPSILITFITANLIVYAYFKWMFSYWKRRNVPFIEPTIPFGTSENPFTRKEFVGLRIKNRYDEFKFKGHKHGGMFIFTSPTYMPIDPEFIKNIMSKDFNYFINRGTYLNEKNDPLSAHLFNLEGQKWRNLRTKLTPTFTSGKMKLMFPTLINCSIQLKTAIHEYCEKKLPIEAKEVLGCFTTDVIGCCAFGIECNSFSNPNSEFRTYGKNIFTSTTLARSLSAVITMASPSFSRRLGISLIPPHITDFFINLVKETVEYRENNNLIRKDFMQILIDLKNNEESLTIKEMAAQAFVFFLAGFETSSSTMSFCLHELARNPDIQEKVRGEIKNVLTKYNGEITYEGITEMKYLSQVVDETLRMYPPAAIIPRVCAEDYHVPGTKTVLEKGTRVLIPVYALHHDPEYYPNPDVFDPERFTESNKNQRHTFSYLPFGEGPRICIGLRFGLMQSKVGLAILLNEYKFTINERTQVPLLFDSKNFILSAKDGIWLNIERLN